MIEAVKDFRPELHVEGLRDSWDAVILEHGEIKIGDAWTDQDIAPRIPAEVKTCQRRDVGGERPAYAGWLCIAIRRPKLGVGRGGNGEALRLDVIVGVPWMSECLTAGTG